MNHLVNQRLKGVRVMSIKIKSKSVQELEKKEAIKFAQSMRGQLIISQALMVAITKLRMVDKPLQQTSNIKDMEYLLNELYPIYKIVKEAEKLHGN